MCDLGLLRGCMFLVAVESNPGSCFTEILRKLFRFVTYTVQYMLCANDSVHYGPKSVSAYLHIAISLHHYVELFESLGHINDWQVYYAEFVSKMKCILLNILGQYMGSVLSACTCFTFGDCETILLHLIIIIIKLVYMRWACRLCSAVAGWKFRTIHNTTAFNSPEQIKDTQHRIHTCAIGVVCEHTGLVTLNDTYKYMVVGWANNLLKSAQ